MPYCRNANDFQRRLISLGYQFPRSGDYAHISVIAPGWKQAVRLDSLGYTNEVLRKKIDKNLRNRNFHPERNRHPAFKPEAYPLLQLEKKLDYEVIHSKDAAVVWADVLFYLLLQLLCLTLADRELPSKSLPLSPAVRQSAAMEKKLRAQYALLKSNDLHTPESIASFCNSRAREIAVLEKERQRVRNSNRRPKTDEERQEKLKMARDFSKQLAPLREDLKLAASALEDYPRVWDLLKKEHDAEMKSRNKDKEREVKI